MYCTCGVHMVYTLLKTDIWQAACMSKLFVLYVSGSISVLWFSFSALHILMRIWLNVLCHSDFKGVLSLNSVIHKHQKAAISKQLPHRALFSCPAQVYHKVWSDGWNFLSFVIFVDMRMCGSWTMEVTLLIPFKISMQEGHSLWHYGSRNRLDLVHAKYFTKILGLHSAGLKFSLLSASKWLDMLKVA